jgi:hypothetical protein
LFPPTFMLQPASAQHSIPAAARTAADGKHRALLMFAKSTYRVDFDRKYQDK